MDPVDLLLERVTTGGAWPPKSEAPTWRSLRRWRAYAEHDREELAKIARWDSRRGRYLIDPIGDRIREGWADTLFPDEIEVTPAAESDEANMTELLEPNDLTEECHAAEAEIVVPEGEAWWRVYVDDEIAEVPLVEWHSRLSVAPLMIGKRLLAAALISELDKPHGDRSAVRYRHFEIHAEGLIEHVLFRGTKSRIGETVPLDSHPELEDLAATLEGGGQDGRGWTWEHGLPMLMGRVINRRGRSPRLGISEFKAIEDQLLALNKVATIGDRNVELTARKRAVVPPSAVQASRPSPGAGMELIDDGEGGLRRADGQPLTGPWYDVQDDVLIADPVNEELGRDAPAQFKVLEYSFDAEPLISHKRDVVETALTRIGMMPEWVGVRGGQGGGLATSGTELRLRLTPTTKAARGKGKPWDKALPHIIMLLARVSELDVLESPLQWTDAMTPPAVRRPDPIPPDPVEDATVESTLVGAGVRSPETSVRAQHPTWDEQQIDDELRRIGESRPAAGMFPA